MTSQREFDPEELKRELMALMGFVHECRGLMFCKACDWEFSAEGKKAIAEFVEKARAQSLAEGGAHE